MAVGIKTRSLPGDSCTGGRRTALLLISSPTRKIAERRREDYKYLLRHSDHVSFWEASAIAASTRQLANGLRTKSKKGRSLNVEASGSTQLHQPRQSPSALTVRIDRARLLLEWPALSVLLPAKPAVKWAAWKVEGIGTIRISIEIDGRMWVPANCVYRRL
ncbi:hypothetical protein SCHPADRAFT_887151 [Schizopora paradoxa]|uniref:Uncharacterized protein n=1 Tax=Schizopora paradoxa TaxID=27342 RepID=A0A0H2RYL6_9AGAM|nr:hypothetical protein SCHPADRAFT_887151 [Schizopora paradoxa]